MWCILRTWGDGAVLDQTDVIGPFHSRKAATDYSNETVSKLYAKDTIRPMILDPNVN